MTHGLVQYLHCLHVGMWGQSRGTGVIPTIVVGAVCLPCLTSIVESVDETCCEGRLQYLQCLPFLRQHKDKAKHLGEEKCLC